METSRVPDYTYLDYGNQKVYDRVLKQIEEASSEDDASQLHFDFMEDLESR